MLLHDTPLPLALCPGRQSFGDGRIHSAEVYEERLGRHYLVTTAPLTDESGRIGRLVQLAQDITERKQAEESRRRLETQVQQAQKLESLGVLAGGIAHDFNNLLMAILGNADLALRRAAVRRRRPARAWRRSSRPPGGPPSSAGRCSPTPARGASWSEPSTWPSVVREMVHILRVVDLQEGRPAVPASPRPCPAVEADATQLRQVIMNLIINASEAIGDRTGAITVTTGAAHAERQPAGAPGRGGPPAAGDYVYLEVADTGCGMDPKTMRTDLRPVLHHQVHRARAWAWPRCWASCGATAGRSG